MALSGSYNYNLTRDEIIESALRKLGVVADGDNATADQLAVGAKTVNSIVKEWQNEGLLAWAVEWATQTLSASDVVVGTDGNDYECIRNHTSAATNKPVTGADYTTFWKATGETGSGSVWAVSTAYTSICNYFLDSKIIGISEAFIRRNYIDTPVTILSRENYFQQTSKTTSGLPNRAYFRLAQTPEIFLYPYPENATDVLHMSLVYKLQDFDSSSDNPDIMSNWLRALEFCLAADLGYNYGKTIDEIKALRAEGLQAKAKAAKNTQEPADFCIQPVLAR